MTCIVGLIHEGVTYIGADSLGSNGHSGVVRKDKKVFHMLDINNAVIGYTSSFRMGQLLMYGTGLIDPRDKDHIDHRYLVTKFIPKVAELFRDGGYGKTSDGEKRGGVFLFGYRDRLYKIESDFQVGESMQGYDACGCGDDFALGSLHSTEGSSYSPIERIHMALQAASHFSVGVAPPYHILTTSSDKKELITFES